MTAPRRRFRDDAGVSLAELIVYSLLLSIVSVIAITVIVQVLKVNSDVHAVASTNNEVQVSFAQLETELRSASQAVVSDRGNLLVIHTRTATSTSDAGFRCIGYFFDESTGALHRSSSEAEAAAALLAGGGSATAGVAASWPVALTDVGRLVDPRDSSATLPVFGPANQSNASVRTAIDTNNAVQMNVSSETAEGRKPVELRKSVTIRPQGNVTGCAG